MSRMNDHEKAAAIAAWISNVTWLSVQLTAEEVLRKCETSAELEWYYGAVTMRCI